MRSIHLGQGCMVHDYCRGYDWVYIEGIYIVKTIDNVNLSQLKTG